MARPGSSRKTRIPRAFGIAICLIVGLSAFSSLRGPTPPITIAAVGDSITTWSGGTPVTRTWAMDLDKGPVVVDYSQGWAGSGERLADMAAAVGPVTDDFLVVMGGVNDVAHPDVTPMTSRIASLEQIVWNSKLPANRVIITAVAPLSTVPARIEAWNAEERSLAAQFGWHYIDPWTSVRSAQGTYLPQYTVEGLHPNAAGSALVAKAIATAVTKISADS
jgi:lysophospholipase L1-like esterase